MSEDRDGTGVDELGEPGRAQGSSDFDGDGSETPKDSLLRNENRRRIVEQLENTPGLNKNQLGKRLELYPNMVEFHLERLEEHSIVVTKPSAQGNEVLCFLAEDEHLWEDEDTRILFGRSPTRSIGLYLAENPGASTAEIAEAMDLSEVTVLHHLKTLREHDLVDRVRLGQTYEYHPQRSLQDWAGQLGERYEHPWNGPEAPSEIEPGSSP